MRFIRTLNKGIFHQTKAIGSALNMQPNEVIDQLLRFGLDQADSHHKTQATAQAFTHLWQEILFTIQSFGAQSDQQALDAVFLFGCGAELKGMPEFAQQQLNIPVHVLSSRDIAQKLGVTISSKHPITSASIFCMSTALIDQAQCPADFLQGAFEPAVDKLFFSQIFTACGLLIALVCCMGTFSFLQIRTIKQEARASQQEALEALKERPNFKRVLEEGLRGVKEKDLLEEAITQSEAEVKKQEEMWFAFTGQSRASMLSILKELTDKIDKDALGFDIEQLSIADGTLSIKARVKNHEALQILERELESSSLFSFVPKQEETSFTMKITLAKPSEG
jgi:hypothetical protein